MEPPYTGAPDECDVCWPNKRHDGPCLALDIPAMQDELFDLLVGRGYMSHREDFDRLVTFSTDQERAEGIVGYPAAGYIYAELGPDQYGNYWLDHVWRALYDKFPNWDFGVYNNAVLSVFERK